MPFHGIMTKILKMAQSLQSLMLDAKIFCLKTQNTQVPICSQYGTLFQSNCSIFQIKSRNLVVLEHVNCFLQSSMMR